MLASQAKAAPTGTRADRNAVLAFVAADSICVVAGFLTNSVRHIRDHGLDYPWIVHLHALTFMSWLVLFNVQVWLVRLGRADRHRRLGRMMAWLAGAMLVIGPATALIRDIAITPPGVPPVLLIVQLTDIIAFAGLTFAALALRAQAAAHKRLMLLGLFYVSDAGFARLFNPVLALPLGDGPWTLPAGLYAGTDLFALALGLYDLIAHRRLEPAYLAGLAWVIGLQALALALIPNPGWAAVVRSIYGI